MEKDVEKTIVVFRKWKDNEEVVAIFPELPGSYNKIWECNSYMHIGQHGSCDSFGIIKDTILAEEIDYADLKQELESLGYVLDIRKKITQKMAGKRLEELGRI